MLIDLHCHILPGIDDGAADEEVTLQMLKSAAASGVKAIAATPHNQKDAKAYLQLFDSWKERAKAAGIDLYPGTEYDFGFLCEQIRLNPDFPLLPINFGRYLLLDFAGPVIASNWNNLPIGMHNAQPRQLIIAHPERLFENPLKAAKLFCAEDAIIQINAGSLLGKYGPHARKAALGLLDAGLCRLIAGDVHHAKRSTWILAEAAEMLKPIYGAERVDLWTSINPQRILNSETTISTPPRKSWLSRLFQR